MTSDNDTSLGNIPATGLGGRGVCMCVGLVWLPRRLAWPSVLSVTATPPQLEGYYSYDPRTLLFLSSLAASFPYSIHHDDSSTLRDVH
jgi:hypothetical protein